MPSLTPRQSRSAVSFVFRHSILPSPPLSRFGLWFSNVSRPPVCLLSLRPNNSPLSFDNAVGRLQHFGFPPYCYPSYRTTTLILVGWLPLNILAFSGRT
ncbi:hypothetical protein AVEN_68665-1, partial [Araneus ventricosus]